MNAIYRLLSSLNWLKAAWRGPSALLRRFVRVVVYRGVNRTMRGVGL